VNTLSQIYICKSEIESILQNIQSENRFLRSSVLCEKNMAASMRYDIESASTDTLQHPEFRSLSELYIVIFLNKLNMVENT
jgi:hypothetical protein